MSPFDIYVRTDVGGAFRFDRTNRIWRNLTDIFSTNQQGNEIEAFAIDPTDPAKVYAVFRRQKSVSDGVIYYAGEVWRSLNKGQTWEPTGLVSNGITVEGNGEWRHQTGERLCIDPNKPDNIWFASRNDGVWLKQGNNNWQQVTGLPTPSTLTWGNRSRTDRPGFTFVIFDRASGTAGRETPTVYVGAHGSGVWRRVNNVWSNISGTNESQPLRAAIARNGDLYVVFGTEDIFGNVGFLKRYRNGQWQDITPSGGGALCGIAVHPDNQQLLLTGNTRMYKSNDAGANWTRTEPDLRSTANSSAPAYLTTPDANNLICTVAFDPSSSSAAWFCNGYGVARSANANTTTPTWRWEMLGLEMFVGVMTVAPPTAPTNFYILTAVMDKCGFKQTNLDAPPTKIIGASGIPVRNASAWTWGGGARTTFPVPIPSPHGCSCIDVAWGNPAQSAYVGYHTAEVWVPLYGKSADHGETYRAFGSIPSRINAQGQAETPTAGIIAVDPRGTDRMVWAPTWGWNPYYTTDGGNTWQLCKIAGSNENLPSSWGNTIDPRAKSHILVSDKRVNGRFYYFNNGDFYISQDAGATWTKTVTGGLPTWKLNITIAPNPWVDNEIYLSAGKNTEYEDASAARLYKSSDGGKSFTVVQSVKTCEFVAIGKGLNGNNPYLFIFGRVGTATKDTLYRSMDNGATWQAISDPNRMQFPRINQLVADPRIPNLLYASSSSRGHFYMYADGVR